MAHFKQSMFLIFAVFLVFGRQCKAVNWNNNNWAMSCDFPGQDLSHVVIASSQCGGKCAATTGCTHFSWTSYNGGTCWMKSGSVSPSNAVDTSDSSQVCGYMTSSGSGSGSITWNGNNWANSCDFPGQDISNARVSSSQCGGTCAATTGCTHFTWTNYNGGTCWMKSGSISPSNAIATGDSSMVCGYISQQQSGKTTRYWDCCKPSCSWSGKANVNKPVNSCAKDGFSILNSGTSSGCGNGGAYTCSNQIPYVGANNVAYGFAAANILGSSESGWCCACYQLTFTSGPVSGKKMIVQVTNTGGDLGANHFDLQIPGGGVGIFNGCSSQWGAPSTGWGAQYGGVSSASECSQLPSQIRAGCDWRFGWFQNADNPTMTFVPVACPAELTQKTGCIRN